MEFLSIVPFSSPSPFGKHSIRIDSLNVELQYENHQGKNSGHAPQPLPPGMKPPFEQQQ